MSRRCCRGRLECQEDACCETEPSCYDYCVCEVPCVCVRESECCPPREPECEDPCEQSYYQTECVEKPKKSFWQQLFSTDKKCCSRLKKKSICRSKRVKKQVCKCGPDCQNEKCQEVQSKNKCNPCECNSKVNTCTRKPCMPSNRSICGCHFYINLENRPTHKKSSCKGTNPISQERESCLENKTCETYGYNVHEEPVLDNESGVVRRSMLRNQKQSPKMNKQNKSIGCKKSKLSVCCLKEKELEDKNKHVGLITVTKEETKYYKPNVEICQNKKDDSSCEINNSSSKESNENINNITVNINNSGVTVTRNDKREESDDRKCLRGEVCGGRTATKEPTSNVQRESRLVDQSRIRYSNRKSRLSGHDMLDLDKRVSEILRKLDCIEQKINTLEIKNVDNKRIRIDFDGQKSTMSLKLNDMKSEKKKECNASGDKFNGVKCKGNPLIEIKRSKSSSCEAGLAKHLTTNRHYSRSLDRCCKNESSCQKIIISLSNKERSKQCVVLPGNDKVVDCTPNNNSLDLSWCDISKNLQSSKCPKTVCYCFECCQKRARCL